MTSLAWAPHKLAHFGCIFVCVFAVHATRKCVFMVIVNNLVTLFSCFDAFIIIYTPLLYMVRVPLIYFRGMHSYFWQNSSFFLFHNQLSIPLQACRLADWFACLVPGFLGKFFTLYFTTRARNFSSNIIRNINQEKIFTTFRALSTLSHAHSSTLACLFYRMLYHFRRGSSSYYY